MTEARKGTNKLYMYSYNTNQQHILYTQTPSSMPPLPPPFRLVILQLLLLPPHASTGRSRPLSHPHQSPLHCHSQTCRRPPIMFRSFLPLATHSHCFPPLPFLPSLPPSAPSLPPSDGSALRDLHENETLSARRKERRGCAGVECRGWREVVALLWLRERTQYTRYFRLRKTQGGLLLAP